MIEKFANKWQSIESAARARFAEKHWHDYKSLVVAVIELLVEGEDACNMPDPTRIHEINDGDCQGTLVYVIAEVGYQPSKYWYVKVSYGSCSGCDSLQAIRECSPDDEKPTDTAASDYYTLATHLVQGLKEMP
jgi:hypothetical protein